ncbi:MAG: protein translocase subunit SecF, partial [Verrucomicrobiales bacterium]|nr:protein translocase subunit SecF [Verrucomicrobiales bacterium]
NITTLITAIILFIVASSTVKGFAVTLISGILASLFSSLLVTRVCFMWLTNDGRGGLLKGVNLWSVLPDRLYHILDKRKKAAVISVCMISLSVGILAFKRGDAVSPDFAGGSMVTLRATESINLAKIDESLADITDIPHITQSLASPSGQDFITVRTSFSEDNGDGQTNNAQRIIDEINKDTGGELTDVQIETVGPVIGIELAKSSAWALGFGLVGIFFYLVFRFETSFAIGAIIALVHDITIVLGLIVLCGEQLSLIHVGAFLTIAGYSINDTIVVFDRIRETLKAKRGDTATIMNLAISQTLSRTVLTSATTLIVVVVLAIFGGPALRDFSVTLIFGVLIGTYSSLFVASPVVLWWSGRKGGNLRREVLDAELARRIDDSGIEREAPERA